MKKIKLFLFALLLITCVSCHTSVNEKELIVRLVQNSDHDSYRYKVTVKSSYNTVDFVVIYTNTRYLPGDTIKISK